MVKFIEARRSELSRLPVAILTLHMQALGDKRDWDRIRRLADGLGEKLQ